MDAPKTNREIAEKLVEYFQERSVYGSMMVPGIERALDAKDAALLEADKNGYERGREEDEVLLRAALKALRFHSHDCGESAFASCDCENRAVAENILKRLAPSVSVSEGKNV